MTNKKFRIAAMGDIHVGETSSYNYVSYFQTISQQADVLLLCGDLTQRGTVNDTKILIEQLSNCTIPIVAVLGNHDYENGQQAQITSLLRQNRVQVLEGETYIIENVAIAGVKGFAGGFEEHLLTPFGEKVVKDYVQETINEALKLENAIGSIDPEFKKVVIMHYSPIRKTVESEHPDIIPFLGSSRLAEPIDRFKVDVVFHGHAHSGVHEGHTFQKVPVFNVAEPLMYKLNPKAPYMIYEL